MNTLTGLLAEHPVAVTEPDLLQPPEAAFPEQDPVLDEQLQGLVQQVFFSSERRVRHVGFTALETSTDILPICLHVASVLAQAGNHDVGLIDAGLQSTPLHTRLNIESDGSEESPTLGPHLWLVSRRSWQADANSGRTWDPSLAKLRTAAMEFDYSIAVFDALSWATTRVSQICDGLVLVVTANKTRRLVAAETREQLRRAHIPVLGAVLAERRLPIPEGLYRRL